MSDPTTPNMNLTLPAIGGTTGPAYATETNNDLVLIDAHNHSPGNGAPIPVAGLSIAADLPLNNNNLTLARSLRLASQLSPISNAADLGCLYESGVDLYYNDGAGNQIRITQSGSVAGSAGTITGLPSGTASAAYAAGTFTWQSSTNVAANMDAASYVLRNTTASSRGLTLSPPSAMGSNYSLVLPALPGSTSFLTLDTSGNITASVATAAGITNANIANATITSAKISASAGITGSQLAATTVAKTNLVALGQQTSSSSGSFTSTSVAYANVPNLSVTITTSGRPVMIMVQPDGTNPASMGALATSITDTTTATFQIVRDSTSISQVQIQNPYVTGSGLTGGVGYSYIPGLMCIDTGAAAGSHTYKIQGKCTSGAATTEFNCTNMVLVAFEL